MTFTLQRFATLTSTLASFTTSFTETQNSDVYAMNDQDLMAMTCTLRLKSDIAHVRGVEQVTLTKGTPVQMYKLVDLATAIPSVQVRRAMVKAALESRGLKIPLRKRTLTQTASTRAVPFVICWVLSLDDEIRVATRIRKAAEFCVEDLKRHDRSNQSLDTSVPWYESSDWYKAASCVLVPGN
ncbi:hypothetical protein RhiTH_008780 [Rhizoctonia solani]